MFTIQLFSRRNVCLPYIREIIATIERYLYAALSIFHNIVQSFSREISSDFFSIYEKVEQDKLLLLGCRWHKLRQRFLYLFFYVVTVGGRGTVT